MVSDKMIHIGPLELVQRYKQNPLEKFFIFNIYQNYTLAFNRTFLTVQLLKFQSSLARTQDTSEI